MSGSCETLNSPPKLPYANAMNQTHPILMPPSPTNGENWAPPIKSLQPPLVMFSGRTLWDIRNVNCDTVKTLRWSVSVFAVLFMIMANCECWKQMWTYFYVPSRYSLIAGYRTSTLHTQYNQSVLTGENNNQKNLTCVYLCLCCQATITFLLRLNTQKSSKHLQDSITISRNFSKWSCLVGLPKTILLFGNPTSL